VYRHPVRIGYAVNAKERNVTKTKLRQRLREHVSVVAATAAKSLITFFVLVSALSFLFVSWLLREARRPEPEDLDS
jgi:predicted neutral ceramidase superfamily lipid hydrolase